MEIPPKSRDCERGWHEQINDNGDLPHRCTGYASTDAGGKTTTKPCGCICHSEGLMSRELKLEASRQRCAERRAAMRAAEAEIA